MKKLFIAAVTALSLAFGAGAAVAGNTWDGSYVGATVGHIGTEGVLSDNKDVTIGVIGGHRWVGPEGIVLGLEGSAVKSESTTYGVKAIAGYAAGDFLPYVALGKVRVDGVKATTQSVGVDYLLNSKMFLGGEYTKASGDLKGKEVLNLRVGYKF